MFAENSGLPCRDVALFDKYPNGFAGLFHRNGGGSDHPFDDRIGIGVHRELRRTFAQIADGDRFATVVDRGALAFGLERKKRRNDKMRRFVREYRASGRGVIPGSARRSHYEQTVAAKPDAGVVSDFDVERNQVASGGLDLCLVKGLSFG